MSPGYWAMRALRGALDGDLTAVLTGWLALAAVALVAGALAVRRLNRGWGRDVPA